MKVKLDTKEKFTVIGINEKSFTANMTDELEEIIKRIQSGNPAHIILDLTDMKEIDKESAADIALFQARAYEADKSFVICCMNKEVEKVFTELDLTESMNTTPTLSEAWDIVQMEEVERELLKDFDNEDL